MRVCRLCKRLFPSDKAICPDDATATFEATLEPLPEELRTRFPAPEPLALGATGTLYLVDRLGDVEAQLERKLVLKVLANELTQDASERARHRRDLRKQQALVHPQLPRVIEEGETEGRVWFTREYVPATSLAVRLHKHGAFEPEAALSMIVQLSAALDGLHQLGLVHRDLKPGHVLLRHAQNGAQGRVGLQLIDATFAAPLTADNPARRGTADYVAKEIVEGAAATVRSDLYALGCLSYELITGVSPFRGASAAADGQPDTEATLAAQRGAEAKELPGNVPQAVRSVITSLLSKDAHRRPFSAQQVRRSIEPVLSPAKPAARSDARSALQREAAALRLTGPTAKPVTPRNTPDATVELDVEDLEEAVEANDREPIQARPKAEADDSAPTIALSAAQVTNLVPQPSAATSQITPTQPSDKSATFSSASARENTTPGLAPDRSHAPNPSLAPQAAAPSTSAPSPSDASAVGADDAAADEGPRRTRTGTKFGLGPVRPQDIEAAAALAAQLSAADAASASAAQLSAADAEVAEVAQLSAAEAAAPVPPAAASVDPAAQSMERSAYPAVREAQPAHAQSMERSAYPALREPQAEAQPAAASDAPVTRAKRYSTSPKSLTQSPHLLLWAAGGLVLLISGVRLAFGPAESMKRSPSVIVRVPEVATELPAPRQVFAELSEQALIGGDIERVKPAPLPTATRNQPALEQPQLQAAADSAETAEELDDDLDSKSIRTVSAGSVRGGLVRAASNRAAAESGRPEASASVDFKAKGRELYQAGKYREAADAYQRATQHNTADAAAFAGLGGSLLATGDTRKAITAYQRAVHLEPAVSGFQAALGRAYLKKGDRARARAAYTKALKLDPKNQAARTGMANAKAR